MAKWLRLHKKGKYMKGYNVPEGYMGYILGEYVLFSCEQDYIETYMELEEI